ncbi:receptor-like protein 42 [Dioscorea cayenensis subsp. rotundata]|uniref:Receptor-like protein 42 n=1 Tax=Dioscorea cayennensis subsp. rotundata TaxID=55577 RepID=A0AB40C3P1_DIOCR|nr:receptor-like protein 42 [Dioscorea cayenensis subsp. rotundata]
MHDVYIKTDDHLLVTIEDLLGKIVSATKVGLSLGYEFEEITKLEHASLTLQWSLKAVLLLQSSLDEDIYFNAALNNDSYMIASFQWGSYSLGVYNIDTLSLGFYDALPPFSSNIDIDFSNNLFLGILLPITSEYLPLLGDLNLSNNLINGTIPSSICNFAEMQVIDLSSNRLFGQVPACFPYLASLMFINLENNNLSGEIPDKLDSFSLLLALHLGNNSISGRIPTSLRACKSLLIIDLGGNKLSGNIPSWIGEALSSLRILRLRANMFEGKATFPKNFII